MSGENSGSASKGDEFAGIAASLAVAGLVGAGISMRKFFGQRRDQMKAQNLAQEGNRHRDGGDLARAAAAWKDALANDPGNGVALNGLAWLLAVQATSPDSLNEALRVVEIALGKAREGKRPLDVADCLNTRAEIRLRRGEFQAAIADSGACLTNGGTTVPRLVVQTWRRAGIAYGYLGQVAAAYDALRRAIAQDPTDLDSRVSLARLASEASDHETAMTEYYAAAQILAAQRHRFANGDFLLSTTLNNLGCALNAVGRKDEADQTFRAAMSAFGGNPYPILNTAFGVGRRGDRAQMRQLVNAALAVADPADAHLTYTILNEAAIDDNGDLVLDALLAYRRIPQQVYLRQREMFGRRGRQQRTASPISGQDPGLGAVVTKMRVLLLSANPLDTPRLAIDEEFHRITEKVQLSKDRDILDLIPCGATRPDDLLQYLNQYRPHIVHFSGHGSSAGEIILAAEGGGSVRVAPAALGQLFHAMQDDIQVVVLNACWSAVQAHAINQHVDWVVGMRRTISDEAAAFFAGAFYRALGFQRTVPEAFEQGRTILTLQGFTDSDVPELLVRPGAAQRIRFGR